VIEYEVRLSACLRKRMKSSSAVLQRRQAALRPKKEVQMLVFQRKLNANLCRHRCLPEVDRSLVVLADEDRPLGRGAFGHVYLGRLHNVDRASSIEDIELVDVAVKIASGISLVANKAYRFTDDAGADAQSSLLRETEIMSRIGRCVFVYFRRVSSLQPHARSLHARLCHHDTSILLDPRAVR